MSHCVGYRGGCPDRAPGTITRRGRAYCSRCDEREQADRSRRSKQKRAGKRDAAHQWGEQCDSGKRGRCPVCSTPGGVIGRPRVVPGEETTVVTVRLASSHCDRLDELAGDGETRSDVIRRLIDGA